MTGSYGDISRDIKQASYESLTLRLISSYTAVSRRESLLTLIKGINSMQTNESLVINQSVFEYWSCI